MMNESKPMKLESERQNLKKGQYKTEFDEMTKMHY